MDRPYSRLDSLARHIRQNHSEQPGLPSRRRGTSSSGSDTSRSSSSSESPSTPTSPTYEAATMPQCDGAETTGTTHLFRVLTPSDYEGQSGGGGRAPHSQPSAIQAQTEPLDYRFLEVDAPSPVLPVQIQSAPAVIPPSFPSVSEPMYPPTSAPSFTMFDGSLYTQSLQNGYYPPHFPTHHGYPAMNGYSSHGYYSEETVSHEFDNPASSSMTAPDPYGGISVPYTSSVHGEAMMMQGGGLPAPGMGHGGFLPFYSNDGNAPHNWS